MKKFIALLTFTSLIFFSNTCNTKIINAQSFSCKRITQEEEEYVKQLEKIRDQLNVLSKRSLQGIVEGVDKSDTLKYATFIKTQIIELRLKLDQNFQKNIYDVVKNPISLGLLDILNYYGASLSYLQAFLSANTSNEQINSLESYFRAKTLSEQALDWVVKEINKLSS